MQDNIELQNQPGSMPAHKDNPLVDEYLAGLKPDGDKLTNSSTQGADVQTCPASATYQSIMRTALENMYEPERLGPVDEVMNKYNCQISDRESAIEMANQALTADGDPYTAFLSNEYLEMQAHLRLGTRKGIGITMQAPASSHHQRDYGPLVITRIASESSPAARAGLKVGDIITHIDGTPTSGKDAAYAGSLLKAGSDQGVSIRIDRDGQQLEFNMPKEIVESPAVTYDYIKDKDIAVIDIDTFYKDEMTEELLRSIVTHDRPSAYVIDLRGNGGGSKRNFYYAASMFVSDGLITREYERVRSSPYEPRYKVTDFTLTKDGIQMSSVDEATGKPLSRPAMAGRIPDLVDQPVAILIDENSFSASESFAAALRDNGAAVLVGTRSGGKGIGQQNIEVPGVGTLMLTTQRQFTPSGKWVGNAVDQRFGLEPDIKVDMDPTVLTGSKDDPQLNAAIEYLESEIKK